MNKIWSEAERQFIRDNAGKLKDKQLAAKLTQTTGRLISIQSVRKQRQKMGITKKPGRGKCEVKGANEKKLTVDSIVNPVKQAVAVVSVGNDDSY